MNKFLILHFTNLLIYVINSNHFIFFAKSQNYCMIVLNFHSSLKSTINYKLFNQDIVLYSSCPIVTVYRRVCFFII